MAPPLAAVITEGATFVVISVVVILFFIRYFNRKRSAALAIASAFLFWNLGALFLFTGKLLSYLIENGVLENFLFAHVNFADLGINIGYAFSAVSNVFIVTFVAIVFKRSPMFRYSKMFLPIIVGALNGVTVGLIISNVLNKWPNPIYDFEPTIYHLFMTFLSFSFLISLSIRARNKATIRWERAGFSFIALSGIFGALIYLSFLIDFVLGTLLPVIPDGFTPFYYLAYGFAFVMVLFGYFGYAMPPIIRNIFKEPEPEPESEQATK